MARSKYTRLDKVALWFRKCKYEDLNFKALFVGRSHFTHLYAGNEYNVVVF